MNIQKIAKLITEDPDVLNEQYYVKIRGKQSGPFTLDQLQTMVKRGQLAKIHSISTDGQKWINASQIPELFQTTQPTTQTQQTRQPARTAPTQQTRQTPTSTPEDLARSRAVLAQLKLQVNSAGKRIPTEDFTARSNFLQKAKPGAFFTHPSFGNKIIFTVGNDNLIHDTTTGRTLQGTLETFADSVTARKNITWVQ